jgi:putative nucleotidyltransferase with HDIG domain
VLKKIQASQLKAGMFVHELGGDWFSHPFLRSRFTCSAKDVDKVIEAGIRELYIDTSRGTDVADGRVAEEVEREVEAEMLAAVTQAEAPTLRVSLAEEMSRAKKLHEQAHRAVHDVMHDVRLGKAIQVDNVESLVDEITESVVRNSGALVSLLRLKTADEYTFLHSVAVSTMMVTFANSLGLERELVRQAGIGGLLHDIGKMKVPDTVLNKPGRLTDDEFRIIKQHPGDGHAILLESPGVGPIPLDITRHHHERMDGSGYPDKLPGEGITQMARMAAIVDVYDAITSQRCYHEGMQPTEALRKMWEWSKFHFDQALLQAFMRTIGIYPIGSLVRLESGRLGVVVDQNAGNLLTPKVRVFFSTKANAHIPPQLLDLSRSLGAGGGDRIVNHETPEKWGVDPMRFLVAEAA